MNSPLDARHLRVVYVVNNAAFFVSHRLSVAKAAARAGFDVELITGQPGSPTLESAALKDLAVAGVPHTIVAFGSAGTNPFTESLGLWQIARRLRQFRPHIVHCASPKGVLYGGLAARWSKVPGLVLAVSGMGYLFTGDSAGRAGLLRRVYSRLVRHAYGHPNKRVIVQNRDDHRALRDAGLAGEDELVLIPGSGVRLEDYAALDEVGKSPIVVLPARMLKDKGVVEFAEAARRLRAAGSPWRFVLVGTADYRNPTTVPQECIDGWVREGIVEWWGHRTDMVAVFAQAGIVCLPSYREGMPKALLEAAAAGCPVVTTDAIGCREAVIEGVTGDLVPVGDAEALATVLGRLIDDPERRLRYGRAGRVLAAERFSESAMLERTLSIYQELHRRASQ
jgi:glycosyltransferase involved in cell wall biosynthesis